MPPDAMISLSPGTSGQRGVLFPSRGLMDWSEQATETAGMAPGVEDPPLNCGADDILIKADADGKREPDLLPEVAPKELEETV